MFTIFVYRKIKSPILELGHIYSLSMQCNYEKVLTLIRKMHRKKNKAVLYSNTLGVDVEITLILGNDIQIGVRMGRKGFEKQCWIFYLKVMHIRDLFDI